MICEKCGMQIENEIKICPNCNSSIENKSSNKVHSKVPIVLLCIFGGALGLHRFYLGYKKTAAIMLGFTLLSVILSAFMCIVTVFPNEMLLNITGGVFSFIFLSFICSMIPVVWALIDLIKICSGKLQPTKTSVAFKRLNKQQ